MDDLASVVTQAFDIHRAVNLARAALVGLLHEAREHEIPAEDLPAYLDVVNESLLALCQETLDTANLAKSIGERLRGRVSG